jgi:negative regulator of sigma E activity
MDTKTKEIAKAYDAAHQLNRIADALEEVIRMVKEDQERSRKYMEDRKDEE